MADVNWALGLQQSNPGQAFAQAFQQGMQDNRQNTARNAMAALVQDPTNQRALAALAKADPQVAMQFQHQQAQQTMTGLDQHRENIVKGAQIIRQINPKDDASWRQALSIAHQAGIDLTGVPTNYDPQYANGLVSLADAFAPQKEAQPTASIQDYEYAKAHGYQGQFDQFEQMLHPGMSSPVTVPYNATVSGGGATATGPNGEKVQYNPQSGQWEPMGGQTASPSGGFH